MKKARATLGMDIIREAELAREGKPISGLDPIIVKGGQHVVAPDKLLSMEGQTERPRADDGVTL